MGGKNIWKKSVGILTAVVFTALLINACNENDDSLAPYTSSRDLQSIAVEKGSYTPKLTWIGGYTTVLGINKGKNASLDSSLIWLLYSSGDNLHYPVTVGTVPSGAQEITSQYSQVQFDSLEEDALYTVWIMKEKAWEQLKTKNSAVFLADTLDEDADYIESDDTITVSRKYFTKLTKNIDVFINIDSATIQKRGKIAMINFDRIPGTNNVTITWDMNDASVTDSISAIGIVDGFQYDINNMIWEAYSFDVINGENVYGASNVFTQPITPGDELSVGRTFGTFPDSGLSREHTYYIWIANKDWDGESRTRFADGYAYVVFSTK